MKALKVEKNTEESTRISFGGNTGFYLRVVRKNTEYETQEDPEGPEWGPRIHGYVPALSSLVEVDEVIAAFTAARAELKLAIRQHQERSKK